MPPPTFLQVSGDAVFISIKLQPRSSKNEIGEPLGNELRIKVTAPPVDSKANEALIELLSETLGCPKSALALVHGRTSPHKRIAIRGISAETIIQRLERK
jgi:uncharacterized protein (TIGR00251 family)